MRKSYEWIYKTIRNLHIPSAWVFGTHPELATMVESGRIKVGRAVDLGCGVGREAIYLASKGFDVTGVDISPTAIDMARRAVAEAGAHADFLVDDVTTMTRVEGPFDLVVDYGTFNDLDDRSRNEYMQTALRLTKPGSHVVLMCFDNKVPPEEISTRFGGEFAIESVSSKTETGLGRAITVYLFERLGANRRM